MPGPFVELSRLIVATSRNIAGFGKPRLRIELFRMRSVTRLLGLTSQELLERPPLCRPRGAGTQIGWTIRSRVREGAHAVAGQRAPLALQSRLGVHPAASLPWEDGTQRSFVLLRI